MLGQSTMRNITLYILFIIIYLVLTYFFSKPLLLDSFVSEKDSGAIARTPLLQPGQTLATPQPGLYRVTGGHVNVGFYLKAV